jgi:type VI secretion system secreted protein VgrG
MFIPRIGQEVIVGFLDGDPDQPIITGRVYNGESMPPYDLPGEMTKSTIKSYSSKGGAGFNEIRFEDKKGDEQLFLHAEKDMDIRVKNDRREWIGRDRNLIVKRDRKAKVERDQHTLITRDLIEKIDRDHHLTINGKEAIKVTGSHSFSVTGDVGEEFKANHSEQVTGNYYLKAMQIVIEAMTGITLKVGGNFININPAGIQMQGTMVMINSGGSPLTGQPAKLVPASAPAEAEVADNADPGSKEPTYKQQREQMSPVKYKAMNAPSHSPGGSGGAGAGEGKSDEKKRHWIEIELVDEDGKPVPGENYMITLPDGSTVATGTTDEKGRARVEGIDPGQCKVTFPDLDKDAWKPA